MNVLHAVEYTLEIVFMVVLALKGVLSVYDAIVLWRTQRSMKHD